MSDTPPKKPFAWSLWIPVILAFLLVITAWTVLIQLARENPVEMIEVEESDGSD